MNIMLQFQCQRIPLKFVNLSKIFLFFNIQTQNFVVFLYYHIFTGISVKNNTYNVRIIFTDYIPVSQFYVIFRQNIGS